MEADFSPMIRRLRVARELKEVREHRKITLQQAGDQLDWSRGRHIGLRDSKNPRGGHLVVDTTDWPTLLRSLTGKAS